MFECLAEAGVLCKTQDPDGCNRAWRIKPNRNKESQGDRGKVYTLSHELLHPAIAEPKSTPDLFGFDNQY